MTAEFLRDAAATAAIFGFFASAWFGWAQRRDRPPRGGAVVAGQRPPLAVSSGKPGPGRLTLSNICSNIGHGGHWRWS